MKYILFFGASFTHGVGSAGMGWTEEIKKSFHQEMFGPQALGEVCQVYELGVPGTTLNDLMARLTPELEARVSHASPDEVYIVFMTGMNDSRAADQPDNHVFTTDDFAAGVHSFIHLAKDFSSHLMGVGLTPIDESKTSPKTNPMTGRLSYFSNQRVRAFEEVLQQTCQAEGVAFVPLFDQAPPDWQQSYLFRDGLHASDRGHEWIRAQVEPELRKLVGPLA